MTIDSQKMADLFTLIEQSPVGQQIVSEKRQQVIESRRLQVAEITQLDSELTALHESYEKNMVAFDQKISKKKKEMDTLRFEMWQFSEKYRQQKHSIESKRTFMENCLRHDADKDLKQAIEFFKELANEYMSGSSVHRAMIVSSDNAYSEFSRKEKFDVAAWKSIDQIVRYCRDCIHELEEMRSQPAVDFQRIEEMKAGIPVNTMNWDSFETPKKTMKEIFFPSAV